MPPARKKLKIGILGCGAIGSRIAKSVARELAGVAELTAVYDIQPEKVQKLAQELRKPRILKKSFPDLLRSCDLLVEAVNAKETALLIQRALQSKKHVLAMSVGKLLNGEKLFRLAAQKGCFLLIPSGAIAGIDAVKAASLVNIHKITLTTRKPISGFSQVSYLKDRGIDLQHIVEETTLFEGDVDTAVQHFPQNINVAATLALASGAKSQMTVRILTSPHYKINSHEIEVLGDFGRMVSRTDNEVCPDNPRTSYLAVLSGIRTLKDFCKGTRIGT
ncbi:MAG: DUF108 domain-containing protein [Candidatus Omnitrophica bacterium]|nr:DUF108 domain-containing protein [Candidatus Omnitrophota bacterium]